jgi:hypothetical protein
MYFRKTQLYLYEKGKRKKKRRKTEENVGEKIWKTNRGDKERAKIGKMSRSEKSGFLKVQYKLIMIDQSR